MIEQPPPEKYHRPFLLLKGDAHAVHVTPEGAQVVSLTDSWHPQGTHVASLTKSRKIPASKVAPPEAVHQRKKDKKGEW